MFISINVRILISVVVRKDLRGKGYGKKIMLLTEQFVKRLGLKKFLLKLKYISIYLHVFISQVLAYKFFH